MARGSIARRRMNEVQKVQRQWEKEREEELGDDMSQEGIFM